MESNSKDYRLSGKFRRERNACARKDLHIRADVETSLQNDEALKQVINVALTRYSKIQSCDARYSLGLWISDWRRCRNRLRRRSNFTRGVGYDINCGVRLARTSLNMNRLKIESKNLLKIFSEIFPGVGSSGAIKNFRQPKQKF